MSDLLGLDDLVSTNWDEINQTATETNKGGKNTIFTKDDERIWKPDYAKEAIYQFYLLPDLKSKQTILGFQTHTVKYFEEGQEKKLFGVCQKSAGEVSCPICDKGWSIYNDKQASKIDKENMKNFLPQQSEYCNILVVKDPSNPANEGKVFLYKLPKVVRDLINERIKPSEKNQSDPEFIPFSPFTPTKTSKLKLDVTIGSKNGSKERCNYDKSKFLVRNAKELEAIAPSNEKILEILNNCYNLKEVIGEYVTSKVIKKERYDDDTTVGKILKGKTASGFENIKTYSENQSSHKVDETETVADISAEEADFMNNL
jgi:hypothetical protein